MQYLDFDKVLDQILEKESRYDRHAYSFVREGLDYTQKLVSDSKEDRIRHVSGQELLQGMRKYALSQYGPMSKTVLNEWGICECLDFGEIVFILIEHSVLAKTKDDKLEDFDGGFSFEEAFVDPFVPARKRRQQAGKGRRRRKG